MTHLNGLSMDVAVTLKCLYRLAFILSFVVMPRTAIYRGTQQINIKLPSQSG